ncbi:MAG: hypothetical protein ACRDID_02545, partial [Ktedonobacterales bacterium]
AVTLAAADPDELAALVGGMARKVEYLGAVVDFFQRAGELAEVTAARRGVRGIGAWSATFILVRGLVRMDADLSTSENLGREVSRVCIAASGQPPAAAALAALLERYGPSRGYWLFYCRNA